MTRLRSVAGVLVAFLMLAVGLSVLDSERELSRVIGWLLVLGASGALLFVGARTSLRRLTVAVLVVAPLLTQAYLRSEVDQWVWQAVPEKLHLCGRTFHETGLPATHSLTRSELLTGSGYAAGLWTARGHKDLWSSPGCAAAYVRLGEDRFVGYALSGGR